MQQYLIAHDLGTSGDKASLFSTEGKLIRSHTESYDVHFFDHNYAEQNPQDWWKAFCKATEVIMEGIAKEDVLAISFSAQMQCTLPVDKEGNPLRPAIIWADQRALEQEKKLCRELGAKEIYHCTGHRASASYSLEKLMWIKEHEPQIYEKTYKTLQAKDYLICQLTGKFVTDGSDASGTNAYDLRRRCWSKEILRAAGIEEDKFPEVLNSTDVVGNLTEKAAKILNLTTETKVVCGGGDGPCSALGAGCIEDNELFLSFGTSAWIGGTTKEMFVDENQVLFCFAHVIPDRYMPCGTMQAAGSTYSYMRRSFYENKLTYEELNREIAASPIGAKGLIFLPYMLGERSPRWNPDTSGSFLGIKMCHEKNDYLRAALEGVAMNLELILKAYREKLSVEELTLTGGGAQGKVLSELLAEVLRVRMNRLNHAEEATSIAAAVLAGVGVGVFEDCSSVKKFVKIEETIDYDRKRASVYDPIKEIFDEAYRCMRPLYGKLNYMENELT